MNRIRFRCPHCRRKLEVDPEGSGLVVPCPDCGRRVRIPGEPEPTRGPSAPYDPPTYRMQRRDLGLWRLFVHYRAAFAGWAAFVAAYAILLHAPGWISLSAPFLLLSFVFGILAAGHGRRLHGAALLLCSVAGMAYFTTAKLTSDALRKPAASVPALDAIVAVPPSLPQEAEVPAAVPVEASPETKPAEPAVPPPAEPRPAAAPPATAVAPRPAAVMAPIVPRGPVLPSPIITRSVPATFQAPEVELPFKVYGDCYDGAQPYCPSGWMGNLSHIDQNDCCEERPHSGSTCIKVVYSGKGGWAGVAWQDPPNNWGTQPGGYDLTGAARLTLWARGEKGMENVEFKVGLLGAGRKHQDSGRATSGKITLTTKWQKYTVDLGGRNLQKMMTGFLWVAEGGVSPVTFYLDDIQFE